MAHAGSLPDMSASGPSFTGVHELLSMIRSLIERRRFLSGTPDTEVRGDHPLPLVCLLREEGANDFLPALHRALGGHDAPQVPHAYLDAAAVDDHVLDRWANTDRQTLPLLPLLDELSAALGADRFGGRPLRFGLYGLADWLTAQRLSPEQGGHEQEIADLLRRRSGRVRESDAAALTGAFAAAPTSVGTVGSMLYLLVAAGRRLGLRRLGRRVPGLGREARWFMRRQPYMVPRHSTSFAGFAERLTEGRRGSENPEQVRKLLVHAFLEDLRRVYRRRHRHLLPKRSGWRRTAYTTVLLDNVTEENGGWELLRLINEVRNETGELDPLLVVAAAPRRPSSPEAEESAEPHPPREAHRALEHWLNTLPGRRQRLVENARYLWIGLPPQGDEDPGAGDAWRTVASFRPRAAPLPARRGVAELLLSAALVLTLLPVTANVVRSWSADCAYVRPGFVDGVSVRVAELGRKDRQCIGYSDNAVQVFGTNPRLRAAQAAIFEQNEVAARLHDQQPGRPYLGIVHFVGLTHRAASPDTDHAAAEELEGLLLRQRAQNVKSETQPLLRIIVANGGDGMRKAPEVVRDMLRPLFDADPSVLGVVGLDRTVEETERAITELGLAGIPAVGTTLTGSGLADLSPLYFQMVPDNTRQARLIARYATHLGAGKVTLHHPEDGDSYVDSLLTATRAELGAAGLATESRGWRSVGQVASLCADDTDRGDEIVYYIGRENTFFDFIRSVTKGCTSRRGLPRVIAADAVSRFVAQKESRRHSSLAGQPMAYVGMGALVTLAGSSCVEEGRPASLLGPGTPLDAFCAGYANLHRELARTLPEDETPRMPWPAERTGTTYDVAGLFVDATAALHERLGPSGPGAAPHRAAVAQQLRDSTFQGATGEVDFREDRVGNTRNLAVLEVTDIYDLASAPGCVFMLGDLFHPGQPRDTATGCPR